MHQSTLTYVEVKGEQVESNVCTNGVSHCQKYIRNESGHLRMAESNVYIEKCGDSVEAC